MSPPSQKGGRAPFSIWPRSGIMSKDKRSGGRRSSRPTVGRSGHTFVAVGKDSPNSQGPKVRRREVWKTFLPKCGSQDRMMGIVGHFLSGLIALHAVLGCCFHHAHVAHQTPCCQSRQARPDVCSCNGSSIDRELIVDSTCCDDTVTGRGHRTDCRERRCEWGVQGAGAVVPDVGANVISVTASLEARLLQQSQVWLQQPNLCHRLGKTRLHAVLAVFLI